MTIKQLAGSIDKVYDSVLDSQTNLLGRAQSGSLTVSDLLREEAAANNRLAVAKEAYKTAEMMSRFLLEVAS